jgi:hypothetical protein
MVVLLNIRAKIPLFAPKMGLAHFRWKNSSAVIGNGSVCAQRSRHFSRRNSTSTESEQDPQKWLNIHANYHLACVVAAMMLVLGKSQAVRRIGLVLCVMSALVGAVAPYVLHVV